MADKKFQALDRLIGKLSAVRKTLRGEERRLLDQMVLSISADEVIQHKLSGGAPDKKHSMREGAFGEEVAMHSAKLERHNTGSAVGGKPSRPTILRNSMGAADEVAMHSAKLEKHNAGSAVGGKPSRPSILRNSMGAAGEVVLHSKAIKATPTEQHTSRALPRITVNERIGVYQINID